MAAAPQFLSTLEENKRLAIRWFEEVWNQGRRQSIFELFPPNGMLHDGGAVIRGPHEFCRFYDTLHAEFSGFHITPLLTIAEDNYVCLHWSASFRHRATAKLLHLTGTSIVRVENGRLVEAWQNWDTAGLVSQLTGIPSSFSGAPPTPSPHSGGAG